MRTSDHLRALLRIGLPLIGGHVAQFGIGLTDTIMLGWYSVEALAAVVIGSSFFFVIFILGSGFAIAVMPLVAEADAEDDQQALRRVTRMGLWLSLIFGVIVNTTLQFARMSAFDLIVILVLLVGGLGLFLRALKAVN